MAADGGLVPILVRMMDARVGSTAMMQLLSTAPEVAMDRRYRYEHSYLTYFVRLMGQITHSDGANITLKKQNGESMNITLPNNATLHDIAQPVSSTRPVSIQAGDDVMLTVDKADRPHVLILHPRQSIDASWKGVVAR
jgi:hypothetical protein